MFDRRAYQRHLPHYQNGGQSYLVTFVTRRRSVLPPAARDITINEIAALHETLAFVHAAVVMPDHVHLIMQPLWDESGVTYAVPVILRFLKGRSARKINLRLNRRGSICFDESHDHQIRSTESLMEKIDYVLNNPVRRGLVKKQEEYRWIWRWWVEGRAEARPT